MATHHEKFPDQVSAADGEMGWEGEAAAQDLLVCVGDVRVKEGGVACHELIQQHAIGPPVHCLPMPLHTDEPMSLDCPT